MSGVWEKHHGVQAMWKPNTMPESDMAWDWELKTIINWLSWVELGENMEFKSYYGKANNTVDRINVWDGVQKILGTRCHGWELQKNDYT